MVNDCSKGTFHLVVEGAGQEHDLSTECRKAFACLLHRYGISRKPRIVCGGGRSQAYDKFKTLVGQGKEALLLIDSEAPVCMGVSPWHFLKETNLGWEWLPASSENDDDLHFMVQCMENWILASDPPMRVGAKNIPLDTKPHECASPENVSKKRALEILDKAFKASGQRKYDKGQHSFALLEKIDPRRLCDVTHWAKRFFETLSRRCH